MRLDEYCTNLLSLISLELHKIRLEFTSREEIKKSLERIKLFIDLIVENLQ